MKFSKNGEFDVVTRVTGPHHHYLGLVLKTDSGMALARVEDLSPSPGNSPLDSMGVERLRADVSRGVASANERLGTNYRASAIRFCGTDPPLRDVYRVLAEHLVEYVARLRDENGATLDADGQTRPAPSRSDV
jgi:hypothetical protein